LIERALLRGPPVAPLVQQRLIEASPPARGRLTRLLGRLALLPGNEALREALIPLLDDPDLPTCRQAALALGRLPGPGVEDALRARCTPAHPLPLRRAIVESLGKIGGPTTLAFLDEIPGEDPELRRLLDRARVMLTRSQPREKMLLDVSARTPGPVPVLLRCKRGLDGVLLQEARATVQNLQIQGPGLLRGSFDGPLSRLVSLRVALSFGFPLPPTRFTPGQEAQALLGALLSPASRALLGAWGPLPARFRVAWRDGGHRRALVWDIAHRALASEGLLLNDPAQATWEVLVWEREGLLFCELIPHALPDLRFGYREADVPAASHPTVAAALALVGGVQEEDVVWDPFTGSGLELCERAWLGPYAEIHGSDRDPEALVIAGKNLENARVVPTSMTAIDARGHRIPGLSLVLSNPPLGHRVARQEDLALLLESVVASIARQLRPRGRLVWLSPHGDRTARAGERSGLQVERHGRVDLGGVEAELQSMVAPRGGAPA
ncbi:MAG: hypothetical protein MUF64_26275, partial [Polyangiaceae bacterium]|nr:hypothetical protein [Polyangiaceae bacterium]